MRNLILSLLVIGIAIACNKTNNTEPLPPSGFDESKLVSKEWYLGHKSTPQMITIRFQSDKTGSLTQCTWVVAPYQYQTHNFNWAKKGSDTITLTNYGGSQGPYYIKVHSLSDTVMVTNNWVVGGISDTIKQTFRTY
jgi:hypothetical protein